LSSLAASLGRPAGDRSLAIASGAVVLALLVGTVLAANPTVGVALVFGLGFALVLVYRPVWAVIGFVPLVFLEAVPALNLAGKAAGLLIAVAWIGSVRSGELDISRVVDRNRRLLELLAALLIWLLLTSLWATDSGAVFGSVWRWALVALLYLIVATWVADRKILIWFCVAFVVGAVLAVGAGIFGGLVEASPTGAADTRLEGGAGDPNFLAAGLVPAIVIAVGLISVLKQPLARIGCVSAIFVCAFGIAASQSRGGLLALLITLVAALLVFRGRRIYVVLLCLGVIGFGAAYFTVTPSAWERVTMKDASGSGRNDLWKVALKTAEAHPVVGVGLQNYGTVAKDYTRDAGPLSDVRKIAEEPHVVHNTYLEAAAETGLIGLSLLLLMIGGSCHVTWVAAKRFERNGDSAMELLARCVLVGTIGMSAAAFFVSAGVDKRWWMLFALGPALLAVAELEGLQQRRSLAAEPDAEPLPSPSAA
jgi:putative inorganic carbon (HCO3(-)) transporter